MKILLMGGSAKYAHEMNKNSEIMPDCMEGFGMVWGYFIAKNLKKKDVEIIFNNKTGNASKCPSLAENDLAKVDTLYTDEWMAEIPEADHCIAFEQRCFYNRDHYFFEKLRPKIKGKITTICDHNRTLGPEDCTFYSRNIYKDNRQVPKTLFTGWAAEPSECYIDKDNSKVSILVDHSYYSAYSSNKNKDYSELIIKDVCKFSKQMEADGHKKTVVRRFVSGGVETLDVNNPWFEIYDRQGLNFRDAVKEYNKADIFIVTHQESLGLSVLEAAMAGALILAPEGCIKPFLIEPLHHLIFDPSKGIPWRKVLNMLNPEKSRAAAMPFSYENVANKIYNYLLK